jgi:hypothetical protein
MSIVLHTPTITKEFGAPDSLGKGVAGSRITGRKTLLEPVRALLGRAMREGVGIHMPARHMLLTIVSNGCCRIQTLLDFSFFEQVALAGGVSQTPAKQSACSSNRTDRWLAERGSRS